MGGIKSASWKLIVDGIKSTGGGTIVGGIKGAGWELVMSNIKSTGGGTNIGSAVSIDERIPKVGVDRKWSVPSTGIVDPGGKRKLGTSVKK